MQSADFEEDVYKKWFRRPTIFIACVWFWLATAGKVVVPAVIGALFAAFNKIAPFFSDAAASMAITFLYQTMVMALPVMLYKDRHPGVELSMRLEKTHPLMPVFGVLAGAAAVPMANCLSVWWALVIERAGGVLTPGMNVPATASGLVLALLMHAVLPGICEELMFRGGILGAWERRGKDMGLVVSSLLFALLHGSIQGLPVQLAMGFALGCVTIWSGSLYAAMGFHVTYNALAMILAFMDGPAYTDVNIYAMISESGGMGLYALNTLACAALFMAVMVVFKWVCRKLITTEAQALADKNPTDWQEAVVLMAGLLTSAVIYISDFLKICGAQ